LRRDILEDLESADNTLRVVSLSWSIIELHATATLLRALGLSSHDPSAKKIMHSPMAKKLRQLKTLGLLSDESFEIVQRFKKKRDDIFHVGGLFLPNYSEQVKRELTNLAISAADVMHDLAERRVS